MPDTGPVAGTMPDFSALLKPRSIAIVGASATSPSPGNRLIRILRASGFDGDIYLVHPRADEIDGIKTWASFADLPGIIDYAFVCVAAKSVPDLVKQARGKVRFMQVMTSGFGETEEGSSLEQELRAAVAGSDIRLLGPNCIGMHSGPGRVSFIEDTQFGDGNIAVVSQSGGLSIDILRRGQQMGLAFNSVLSVGNSLDLGAEELLAWHLQDPQTQVIGLYVENVRDGRVLFELLRDNAARKPVVILKGGMTKEGSKAAASHTGSIADDERVWKALARQTGAVLVNSLGDFLGLLELFQAYPVGGDNADKSVVLVGNGGGASVLAADQFALQGLTLHQFSDASRQLLAALDVPAGSSLENPVDVPANALRRNGGRVISSIFDVIAQEPEIGAIVMHLNLTVFAGYDSETIVGNAFDALVTVRERLGGNTQVALVVRSDYSVGTATQALLCRQRGAEANIPVFDELPDAAHALGAFKKHAAFRLRLAGQNRP